MVCQGNGCNTLDQLEQDHEFCSHWCRVVAARGPGTLVLIHGGRCTRSIRSIRAVEWNVKVRALHHAAPQRWVTPLAMIDGYSVKLA